MIKLIHFKEEQDATMFSQSGVAIGLNTAVLVYIPPGAKGIQGNE